MTGFSVASDPVSSLTVWFCSPSALSEPKPEAAPSPEEPSPPPEAAAHEAESSAAAPSETSEPPTGCLHALIFKSESS